MDAIAILQYMVLGISAGFETWVAGKRSAEERVQMYLSERHISEIDEHEVRKQMV